MLEAHIHEQHYATHDAAIVALLLAIRATRPSRPLPGIARTILVEHACSAGTTHFLRFDKVSVLAREKYFLYFVPRKVREAIEISRRPNFNRDGGWALPPDWKPSLQSASAYNVAGLECDTVSAVCNKKTRPCFFYASTVPEDRPKHAFWRKPLLPASRVFNRANRFVAAPGQERLFTPR
ncbi:hypothetical protein SFRURICE_017145 [Spodoptera frugiperda]|nr:hypothetical protein SFRURICE_017145 [Spodoptera frugiperda]